MRTTAVARRILQQLRRDRRTVAMILFAPILILSLVWLIFDGDPYPTKMALVKVPPPLANALAAEDVEVVFANSAQAEAMIRADEVDALLTFGGPSLAVLLEGSKPLARQSVMIALQGALAGLAPTASPITPEISFLHGDAEMAPFAVQAALITSVSIFLLDMMLVGSFFWLLVITMLLAATALTLEMLLSAAARTEFQMIQFIPLVIIPQVFFSGLFPLETIDPWLRSIGTVFPLTYGAEAMREVMIRGGG